MNEIAALEHQLAECQKAVERRDKIRKLCKNKEFKELILEYFMVQECARFVQISADPTLKAENRADALALAQSAGHFKRWLTVQEQMGEHAESQLENLRGAIDEARIDDARTEG